MNRITLDNITCGKVRIDDSVLVEYAMSLSGKIVVVTSCANKWSLARIFNSSVIFIDGSGEKIRGVRANSVFILSDSNLSDKDINNIIAGLVSINNSPLTNPRHDVRFIWNTK